MKQPLFSGNYTALLSLVFLILTVLILTVIARPSFAGMQEFTINAGQSRNIEIPMFEASNATSVKVSGNDISARIQAIYSDRIRVKLTAKTVAAAGLRTIEVWLNAKGQKPDVSKNNLYVYGLPHASINPTGVNAAGKLRKVEIAIGTGAGLLTANAAGATKCYGANRGQGNIVEGSFPVQRRSNKATFWVTSLDNSGKGKCQISIRERSTIKKQPVSRDIMLEYKRDNSVPLSLDAPRVTTKNNQIVDTRNRRGNSPILTWNSVNNANSYVIRYKKQKEQRWQTAQLNSGNAIQNLPLGEYQFCVVAQHRPKNSYLPYVNSDCSADYAFIIRQGR